MTKTCPSKFIFGGIYKISTKTDRDYIHSGTWQSLAFYFR